ncbi:hypothetical protein [Methylobacterium sp. J-070]|uniref:hypothetical protein n=1 Tax=Methylobacterium sp. J-070 TaxID=2836650 RepID=UPI001FB9F48D|nr:hypothetical protein [Methylobacterium sp. J-070]MCJ2048699.1 hypothetical protein [Methylobacterium sp. J-070]
MHRRRRDFDRQGIVAPYDPSDRTHWEPEDTWHGDEDEDDARRPRRGVLGRVASLVKLTALGLPVALFLYGSFADCGGRPATGWLGLVGAGACARHEMLGTVLSMQDSFALLKRLTD